MNNRAFRIAMIHVSQTQTEEIPKVESPLDKNKAEEKITLSQRKKVIADSVNTYYSSIINTYLRKYDDIGQLMSVAQNIVSHFSPSKAPVEAFQKRIGNIKVKILNAAGDTAVDNKNSLNQTFLTDPAVVKMDEKELDEYIREKIVEIKNNSIADTKKVKNILKQ